MLSNYRSGEDLRAPGTARTSSQSILKEINPEYVLEGLMLKLKLQYFGHLMWRGQLIRKDPDGGKDWRQEEKGTPGRDGWMASLTQWTCVWASSGRQWRTRKPGTLQSRGSQRVRHDLATEQQQSYKHKEPDSATIMGAWRKAQKSRWECSCSQYLDFSQERFWAKNSVRSHRTSDL